VVKEHTVSHHLNSPLDRKDPRLNVLDQFVFRGETGTVLIMNTSTSLAGDDRIPGFHPEARYEFKIHFDGLMYEDLTYRLEFADQTDGTRQTVTVHRLTGEDARRDIALGVRIADGETGTEMLGRDDDDGVRVWAGEVLDPFYLDLTQLGAVTKAVDSASMIDNGDWKPEAAANTFAGASVNSIVIELPEDSHLFADRGIAVWCVTKLATDDGGWSQVNRFGIPMMWPIFRPKDSVYASETNTILPADDWTKDGAHLASIVAGLAGAYGTANAQAYGERLADRLLPDVLPYQIGTAAEFGFAGFNGRMLADNAAEVMFTLAANAAVSTGLTPQSAEATRTSRFPYVVPA
jgi:hypothetical protein